MILEDAVFWGLCAGLAFLPLPYGAVEEWAIFVFEAATILLFAAYLVWEYSESREKGERREFRAMVESPKFKFVGAMVAVFLAVAVLQLLPFPLAWLKVISPETAALYTWSGLAAQGKRFFTLSLVPAATRTELVKYACYGLFAWLLWRVVRTRRRAETVVLVILGSALFQAAYGLAEYFGGTGRIFSYKNLRGTGSAFGTFINRDHYAGFLEMAFPLSLGYLLARADFFALKKGLTLRQKLVWFSQERLQKVIVLGAVAVVLGVGLFFSRSRSGVLILVVTFFLMMTALSLGRGGPGETGGRTPPARRLRQGRFLKVVRTTGLALAFTLVTIGIKPVLERFTLESILREARPRFYDLTLDMIRDHPLFGTGAGTYIYAYTRYERQDLGGILHHAHNDYLETLAEMGLIGGGAIILAAFVGLGLTFGRWLGRNDVFARGVGLGAMGGIAAVLIHSLSDFNLRIPANAVYFVALYALGMRAVGLRART